MVISGKELAAACKAKMAEQVKTFPEKYGRLPHLVVVLVGEDAGSVSYVTGKTKAADEVGILNTTIRKPADISEEELLKIIDDLNADDTVDGILIQLPLPKHIDSDKVIARIRQEKDVDGFSPVNVGRMQIGEPCYLPCTPAGCIRMIESTGIDIGGKNAVVIGRSNIVGKPAALLLLAKHATVTICHSRSENLPAICREADILVVAAGKAGMVGAESVRAGQIVLDVGIHVGADGNLCGDTRFAEVEPIVEAITPVPGGVGAVTTAILASHVIEAARRS